MLSNLLEIVETAIARCRVEGNTEGVAITLLEVDIYVFRCFTFNYILFKPGFKLTFEVIFVMFRDFSLVGFKLLKEFFFFNK